MSIIQKVGRVDGREYDRWVHDYSCSTEALESLDSPWQNLPIKHFHGCVEGGKHNGAFVNQFVTNDNGCLFATTGVRNPNSSIEEQMEEPIESDCDIRGFILHLMPPDKYGHHAARIHNSNPANSLGIHNRFAELHTRLRGQFEPFRALSQGNIDEEITLDPRLARWFKPISIPKSPGLVQAQKRIDAVRNFSTADVSPLVKHEIKDDVAYVTLSNTSAGNALTKDMVESLIYIFSSLEDNETVRAIVLRADGAHFCTGGDLKWTVSAIDITFDENLTEARVFAELFETINKSSKIVIGKIQGTAAGAGVGLVSVCDIVLAYKNAKFILPEPIVGLTYSIIEPFVLSKIGEGHARHVMLTPGKVLDADYAKSIGLVSETVPTEDPSLLDVTIEGYLKHIRKSEPKALRRSKELIFQIPKMGHDVVLDSMARQLAEDRVSDNAQERMDKFLNRQKKD